MFKKLISNLPFNPSLIGQVSFYATRIHKEERLRRVGFVFVALSLVVQMFAVMSRPESSLALSNNDIIPGGFRSKTEAINHCNANNYNFRDILARFGISCANVSASSTQTIRSTDYNRKLLSMGRLPYGKAGERPIVIGGKTYYQRYLWAWDSGAYSSYTSLVGTTPGGAPFMILYNCGNVTVVESPPPAPTPTPPAPPPPPAPVNKRPTASFTANCSTITWKAADPDGKPRVRLYIATSTVNSDTDWANKGPFVHSVTPTGTGTANDGSWSVPSQYRNSTRYRVFAVVSDRLPNGQMDDTNYLRVSPTIGILFGPCVTAPPSEPPPVTPPPPTDQCPYIPGTQTSESQCDVCQSIPGTQSSEAECAPCAQSTDNDTTVCLVLSKAAANNTQNIGNADGTVAKANDVITYTLSVKNTGLVAVKDFVVVENISDILDYAVVTDFHGGKLGDGNIVSWPATDVPAGGTINKQLTVKIKSPIPETPIASSNPGTFDLTLTNVYGNTVNIKLPSTIAKSTEQVIQTLPNTGPGTSMAIAVVVTVFASYFFARTRLVGKELDIIRHEFVTSGGV